MSVAGQSPNFYFSNFKNSQEQQVLDDLINESIGIYGQQMYYVPRKINNLDPLYTADDQSSYEQAFMVPIYTESFDQFTGDQSFMSKFGLQIRNQIILSISIRAFDNEVGAYTTQVRPNEGDIIYFPLNNNVFQIKYVEKFQMFYPLGRLYTWKMYCELFEYSNELFNTGIPDIDKIQVHRSTNILDYAIKDEQGNYLLDESGNYLVMESYKLENIEGTGMNETIQAESDQFIDFSVTDPFSEGKI
jgi:Virus neck protein